MKELRTPIIMYLFGCMIACTPADESIIADMVVTNANVITVDTNDSQAAAFAIIGNKFSAVGTSAEIKKLIGKKTKIIDVRGKTITPGFIDAHLHPIPKYPDSSIYSRVDLSPKNVRSMEELIEVLKEKAKITPHGLWIIGSRYQDTKLGRHPTRHDLDQSSTEHIISISHSSGHIAVVNTLALKNAKITRQTPDPPGGAFDREKDGRPNGVLREKAKGIVFRGNPVPQSPTEDEKLVGYISCFNDYLSKGITSVGDAGNNSLRMPYYQELISRNQQKVRIYAMFGERDISRMKALHLHRGFGNEWLWIGAIKIYHGNSLSGRTCWLYEPYDKINPETGNKDYYGIPPARSQAELDSLVFEIHQAGYQLACHANGDREIDMVLDAIEQALQKLPRDNHRHRIEHCSVSNMKILARVNKLGVILALHSYIYDHGDKMEDYGPARWSMMHPNKSAIEMGIVVAGNSDSNVSEAFPMLRIQSMVTRTTAEGKVYGAEQKVSVGEAIRIWTMGSAYASFEDDVKGSISVGKLADFVILSSDPNDVPPETIKDITVEKTYVGGKLSYSKN